jgi:hypothetical protein
MARISRVQQLRDMGFDESRSVPFERAWDVKCSQCEALVINGVATHERGCPNTPRDELAEDEF